jgi:hypothetical protein
MSERWLGWHFLRQDGRTGKRGRRVVPGAVMSCRGSLALCHNGLHASRRALDALKYAPDVIVERVELIGKRLEHADKACARSRRCLWMADATNVLHEFTCSVAEQLLTREREAGQEPDHRSWNAVDTKRRWLRGEATDDELDAATAAAWAVARAGAETAAAWAAAWAEAETDMNDELERLLWTLAPDGYDEEASDE